MRSVPRIARVMRVRRMPTIVCRSEEAESSHVAFRFPKGNTKDALLAATEGKSPELSGVNLRADERLAHASNLREVMGRQR